MKHVYFVSYVHADPRGGLGFGFSEVPRGAPITSHRDLMEVAAAIEAGARLQRVTPLSFQLLRTEEG